MDYIFVFKALYIYQKKLMMILGSFYEMENVFYKGPSISYSELNLGIFEGF